MQKCLKCVVWVRLRWFQKQAKLYVSLWENNNASRLIYYPCKQFPSDFMVSIFCFKSSLIQHDVKHINNGPIYTKIDDKKGSVLMRAILTLLSKTGQFWLWKFKTAIQCQTDSFKNVADKPTGDVKVLNHKMWYNRHNFNLSLLQQTEYLINQKWILEMYSELQSKMTFSEKWRLTQ